MRNNGVEKISSWEKINIDDIKYIGRKNADYSIFNGFRINIPLSYQVKFLNNIYMDQTIREKLKVKILCNNEVFNAVLLLPSRVSGNKVVSLIYDKDLQNLFKEKLSKSYNYTTEYYNKFNKKLFNIPRKYAEHIDFYVGDSSNTFLLRLISREKIGLEEKQKRLSTLNNFKEKLDFKDKSIDKTREESSFKNRMKKEADSYTGKESEEEIRWRLGFKGDNDFKNIKYNYDRNNEIAIGEDLIREEQGEKCDFRKLISNVNKVANSLKEVYAKELCEHIFSIKNLNEEMAYKELEKELLNMRTKKYERDINAREECLSKHGSYCLCCGTNLENIYGKDSNESLEVHYIKENLDMEGGHILNPYEDLRPVCPNCHSIIHSKIPTYTIEEVREKIRENKL